MKDLYVPKDVIKHLEEVITPLKPTPKTTMEQVMYQAGRLQVLEHLKELHKIYEENP